MQLLTLTPFRVLSEILLHQTFLKHLNVILRYSENTFKNILDSAHFSIVDHRQGQIKKFLAVRCTSGPRYPKVYMPPNRHWVFTLQGKKGNFSMQTMTFWHYRNTAVALVFIRWTPPKPTSSHRCQSTVDTPR